MTEPLAKAWSSEVLLEVGARDLPTFLFPQQSAERCVSTLLDLIQTKVNYVVQEAIVVIKDIFRKYPNKYVPTPPSVRVMWLLLGTGVVGRKSKKEPLPSSLLLCHKWHSRKKPIVFFLLLSCFSSAPHTKISTRM